MRHIKSLIFILLVSISLFLLTSCTTTYEVKYHYNYNDLIYKKETVEENSTLKEPLEPIREGYKFVGWFIDDVKYNFNQEVKKDLDLYAHWQQQFVAKFYLGYDNLYLDEQIINANEKVVKPQIDNREGFTFLGWFLNNELYDFEEPLNNNITLIANWEETQTIEKYLVTFKVHNDENNILTKEVTTGEKVAPPLTPTYDGYKFIGWYLNNQLYDFDSAVNKDLTIEARWEKIHYLTVTFNPNNEEPIITRKVVKNEFVNKPLEPTKEGYEFLGWYVGEDLFDFESEITEDIILTALWKEEEVIVEKVIVAFDVAGGNPILEDLTIVKGETVTKPVNPTREGYEFLGWYLNDKLYNFNNEVNEDIVLMAKWEEIIVVETFTIVYKDSGGNYTPERETVIKNEFATKPIDPTKEGHLFKGWYYNNKLFDFDKKINQNYILEGHWLSLENKTFISEFKESIEFYNSTLSGVITSIGLYNYLVIEDESGAVQVSIDGINTVLLQEKGFKVGKRITFAATRKRVLSIVYADTTINDIVIHEGMNELPPSVNITGIPTSNLTIYDSRLVSHDEYKIVSITEIDNELIFLLKDDKHDLITARYDLRIQFIGYSNLFELLENDLVEINNALLVSNEVTYLSISGNGQIAKIGEAPIEGEEKTFDIFYLNDTHGAVLNEGQELGLSKIGNFIKNTKDQNSIFITGGDILQGQLISNANKGAVMIEVFNHLNLDAFVIGNHEFDWGLDVVLNYFNPNTPGVKANFPLLGANVKEKATNQRPEFIDSYVIIERNNFNIGIVGVIGDGQESSISRLRVEDYYFSDAYTAVRDTIEEIKNQVDFILVVNHDNNASFNNKVALLPKVGAIFNGHSHSEAAGYIGDIPYIQSRHNGYMVGQVSLTYKKRNNFLTLENTNVKNVKTNQYLNQSDSEIDLIIDSYYNDISHLYTDVLLTASRSLSRDALADFAAKLMAEVTGSVFSFQNYGGTRTTIAGNITGSDVFKVFPFDNQIISAEITGKDLKALYNKEGNTYLNIDYNGIRDNQYYKVATNDFLYYASYNQRYFSSTYNTSIVYGDLYETFYDLLVALKAAGHTTFDTSSPIIITATPKYVYNNFYNHLTNYNYIN